MISRRVLAGLAFLAFVWVTPTKSLGANPTAEQCAIIRGPAAQTAEQMTTFLEAIEAANFSQLMTNAVGETTGDLRTSLDALESKRGPVVQAFQEYVAALQDLAYQLQVCSR